MLILDRLLAIVRDCSSSTGIKSSTIAEQTGLTSHQVATALMTLKKRGLVFSAGRHHYFPSLEAMTAGALLIEEARKEAKRQVKIAWNTINRPSKGRKQKLSPKALEARRARDKVRAQVRTDARRVAKGLLAIDRSAPKAAKPKYVPKPKKHQVLQITQPKAKGEASKLARFKASEAENPNNVQVQTLPSPPPDRWNVSVPVVPIQQWGKRPFA